MNVASLIEYPELLNSYDGFPKDVVQRAKELLAEIGSIGAYTHSQGIPIVRKRIAQFINGRDGFPADPDSIFCTAGASEGVKRVLDLLISKESDGIMIPIPQYPLYTASITLCGGRAVPYYLDESSNWDLTERELEKSLKNALEQNTDVKALCIINPGNPTGQCLSESTMKSIVKFCRDNKLVLLADEVYQANIYRPSEYPFHSFKKILKSMGAAYESVQLISFHSISKGLIGECGRRGGYFECANVNQDVKDLLYKMASVSLCPPAQGQVALELMVNPPKPGDASFELFQKEQSDIYESLKRRSQKLQGAFNEMEGVCCNPAFGAMYLFPKITLPETAIQKAKELNYPPDEFYCLELLENTGVSFVPGSGFGQQPGTFHFRSTFLPPEETMDTFIKNIKEFHVEFMAKYK
ncbi:hypothetical protein HK103_005431 [Boothiomyces macroporosus]|uniref:Aminotransferase class I/classII large domain-containing protein n=1 Tax=Boothiomyces macroporosus TaxID=261099 RepID=A0AAD5YAV8_9FUNG|nr:hypothetical protein HK103_005431 [Boothiomyces macroporosus]